jgi:SAM-dependent methyltransferase
MDLRSFRLPSNINKLITKEDGKQGSKWYQPFVFRDDLITGACGPWALRAPSNVCTVEDPVEFRKNFLNEAIKLGEFYDRLSRIIIEVAPTCKEFLEIACNVGHLCFDLTRQGKKVTGVDLWESSYEIVRNITNVEFEYLNLRYNIKTHSIPELGARVFDFVMTINFANHLIDLPFFINYIGSRATKGFLFACLISYNETPVLQLRVRAGRKDNPLLHRFEYIPSSTAIELMLHSLKFKYVYHYQYNKKDPKYTKSWGIWLITNEEVTNEVLIKYNLTPVMNKIEEYAEEYSGVLSVLKSHTKGTALM